MATTLEQNLVADADLFSSLFDDEAGKKWFVKKIVAHAANAADVESASRQHLEKAKALVFARGDLSFDYVQVGVSRLEVDGFFARAMYGAMGVHPAVFLDQDNLPLLIFIAKRRVRTILQMRDHVNSATGVFDFPDVDVWHSSLRPSARPFWQGNQAPQSDFWPFVLTPQGRADRVAAVQSLFSGAPRQNVADRHRVECQTAATMVLMDSLLVADNAATLLASLDSAPDGYFAIDNPDVAIRRFPVGGPFSGPSLEGRLRVLEDAAAVNANVLNIVPPFRERPLVFNLLANDDGGVQTVTTTQLLPPGDVGDTIRTSAAPLSSSTVGLVQTLERPFPRGTRIVGSEVPLFHFLTDARPGTALFEQRYVPLDDVQPGDVIHVVGHPFLRAKIPTSPFGGERCVVVNPWHPFDQIGVTGHGVGQTTIVGLAASMLRVANRLLTISRRVLNNCLNPALTLNPAAAGVSPTPDNTPQARTLDTRIKETIARALNMSPDAEPWTAADFFVGTWEVYNLPAIEPQDLPAWDRQGGFRRYPAYWALTARGTVRNGPVVLQFDESEFFAFGYWPTAPGSIAWPEEFDKNFIALVWGLGRNPGATDERRQFGIPYVDDHAGRPVAMPLFTGGAPNARAAPTILTFADMLPQLFYLARNNEEAWVLRPRVSGDAAYLTRLRTIGALPNSP